MAAQIVADEAFIPFFSGGRSVTLMISMNTIPCTPVPEPENW